MKYIVLLITLIFTSCGYTFIPNSNYEADNTSPYVIGATWNGNNKLDISRKTNSSFDAILNVSDEEASVKGKNYNVVTDPQLLITFSEDMYTDSLFQYGVSESVVVIEGEPSRSLLTDIATPPLTDSNVSKILKVKLQMLSENNKRELLLDFSDAEDCLTEEDFKTKFCKLKKDTDYTLIVSKKVMDKNGRELVLRSDDGKIIDDNFVLLFRTTGTPPTVISTQPQNNEAEICLNLQEVKVDFSTEMDMASVTDSSLYLSSNGNNVTDATLITTDKKSVTLKLNSVLNANSTYKINIKSKIRSKSRVNIEPITFSFTTAASASNQGPSFLNNPVATVVGNSITINWKTDVKSLADIKYGKGVASMDFPYNDYSLNHTVTIEADQGPGGYIISITPKDRCGNISTPKEVNATILNHPLISEVSANPSSQDNEFIELYNDGEENINLSNYTLVIGSDEYTLENKDLPAKGYALLIDSTYSITVNSNAVIMLQDIDLTKSEDVFLKFNGTNVDSFTYDIKASASSNLSAQRIVVTLRNSDSTNYCEATPTPGAINACQ